MNLFFFKMGSLAKIKDLTTWPHNNHIFQQHLYMRFTKYHDRWPSWSNPFVQRLENLTMNFTHIGNKHYLHHYEAWPGSFVVVFL